MVTFRKITQAFALSVVALFSDKIFGEDSSKAVTEASVEKGMRINSAAQKSIGIKTVEVEGAENFNISKKSIVFSRDQVGIYVLRDGWFKFVTVKIISKNNETFLVSSKDKKTGDRLVVEGSPLLRVSEMEAFSTEE